MRFLVKGLVYFFFLVAGAFMGMLLSGKYIDYAITFDGVPATKLTEAQIQRISRSNVPMEQRTSVVVDGRTVVSFSGQWFMWLVVLMPVVLGAAIAHLINKWLYRPKQHSNAET